MRSSSLARRVAEPDAPSAVALAVRLGPRPFDRFRDYAALGKPRLSLLVIFTAGAGLWLAPTRPSWAASALFLLATAGLVAAANALNCWLEREVDGLMRRTRGRPLPAGRIESREALVFGLVLAAAALAVIALSGGPLAAGLGLLALATYVLVYTPMKRVTPLAVLVGAVPGAIPPLMGWTAATGEVGPAGLYLAGILFAWQLPHFLAISLYLEDDYRRGGLRVLPVVHGDRAARLAIVAATAALVAFTLIAAPASLAGAPFRATAALLGAVWLVVAAPGIGRRVDDAWARRVFGYSLVYLPIVIAALVLDAA